MMGYYYRGWMNDWLYEIQAIMSAIQYVQYLWTSIEERGILLPEVVMKIEGDV